VKADFFKNFEEVGHGRPGTGAASNESDIGLAGWPFDAAFPILGSAHL